MKIKQILLNSPFVGYDEEFCSEIPGELSRVNMISSHVKITCYFTRENIMLFSQVLRSQD